ncbi:putative Pyruvate carboxylase [Blattamonas nauphoetae]|uniref:acetyl-CoA carboxytransferase n=1 Tax=Blattamonas nauphoetae TaxID=2049346 RepID=A0ABQ9YM70_9EUKA|nr:putative Pyruvate carboxylase [Blattamonas nauphoetae]
MTATTTECKYLFEDIACKDFLDFSFGGKNYQETVKQDSVKNGQLCGIVVAHCKTNNVEYIRIDMNFKYFGGSLGCAEGEKLTQAFEYAVANRLSVVLFSKSGGVRMQEGAVALMMMAKVSVAVSGLKAARLPFINVFEDPTYGGVSASYAMQADIRIGIKGARVGFAGPNVIMNTMYNQSQSAYDEACPKGFQSAEFLHEHGQLDTLVSSEEEALKIAITLFDLIVNSLPSDTSKEVASVFTNATIPELAEEESLKNSREIKIRDYNRGRQLDRIQAQDICTTVLEGYTELSGDGQIGTDHCIHGGIARLPVYESAQGLTRGQTVIVVGTFKAHTDGEFAEMGYAMSTPQGYRTALRLMKLAEHFHIPALALIDTVGAEPSFAAERDGQSEAIATNLLEMAKLRTPLLSCVLGEGGSGGALGLAMGNSVAMFSSAWYSVISPEGAASILGRYKDEAHKKEQLPKDAAELATAQHIYADQLLKSGVIDAIIWEDEDLDKPRETFQAFPNIKKRFLNWVWTKLKEFCPLSEDDLVKQRYNRFRTLGPFDRVPRDTLDLWKKEIEEKEAATGKPAARVIPAKPVPPRFVHQVVDYVLNAPAAYFKTKQSLKLPPVPTLPTAASVQMKKEREESHAKFLAEYETKKSAGGDLAALEKERLSRMNAKAVLDEAGPEALSQWLIDNSAKRVLVTDTAFRDAHQSLLATRLRTVDMLNCAEEVSNVMNDAFSLEMWGGATFDVALRFLHEDPFERVRLLRKKIPNICFQMLIRGSNVVGYTNYPDNAVERFCEVSAKAGIDIFRIFDCFNDLGKMEASINAVRKAGKVAEVCICYTSDFLDPEEKVYTLDYYADLAVKIEGMGAHILGIKDMAGLMKPQNAAPFIEKLRSVTKLPIHFHTHNTSGAALASCLEMARAGCEIVDLANSALGDLTSQPSLNAFLAATANTPRPSTIPYKAVEPLASYLSGVRSLYQHLEVGQLSSTARVYDHEIPGGQYSNLLQQSKQLGIFDKWDEALDYYRDCNKALGNVIKVTPSSKAVGDMALFLLNKGASIQDVLDGKVTSGWPESVHNILRGDMGFPHHWKQKTGDQLPGHVHRLREVVGITEIRGETAKKPPLDFEKLEIDREAEFGEKLNEEEIVSSIMYPAIYPIYRKFIDKFGDMAMFVPTRLFHFGLEPGQTITMKIPFNRIDADLKESLGLTSETGPYETLEIQLIRITAPDFYNTVTLTVRVNKQVYQTKVTLKAADAIANLVKADPANKCQIGSSIPGTVSDISVTPGAKVQLGQNLAKITSMKMEVHVQSPFEGVVESIAVKDGMKVATNSLLFKLKPSE